MQLVVPLYYIATGVTFFLGLQALFLAQSGYSKRLLGWFSFLCFTACGYEFSSSLYHSALSLEVGERALHGQSFFLLLCIPAHLGFVGTYTHDPRTIRWFVLAIVNSAALLLLDWNANSSLRFIGAATYQQITLPWGEGVAVLTGERSLAVIQLHITGQVLLFWSLWRAFAIRRTDRRRFLLLMVYVVFQLVAAGYGVAAELGQFSPINLVGFAFLSLVLLMAANLALDMRTVMFQLGVQRDQLEMERSISGMLKADQERLSQVVAQSPHSIYLLDREGRLIQKNIASRRMWRDSVEHGDLVFRKPPWSAMGVEALCRSALAADKVQHRVVELEAKYFVEGERSKWIDFTAFPISGAEGCNDGIAIISEDVSRQKTMEKALRMVASGVPAGTAFFDDIARQLSLLFEANFVYIARIFPTEDDFRYTTLSFWVGSESRENFSSTVSGGHAELAIKQSLCVIPSGLKKRFANDNFVQFYNIDAYIGIPLRGDGGELVGFIVVMHSTYMDKLDDVLPILEIIADRVGSELQRLDAEKRIRRMAYEDYVTRLPNRAMLHEYVGGVIREVVLEGLSAAAYFLDLDHFKTINEALGHDVGDEVLRKTGERLASIESEQVFVARLGGDEFVVIENGLRPETLEEDITNRADGIIELLSYPLELGGRIVSLGTSVGIVKIPEHANNELDVLKRGDSALFKAKQEGRNRFEIYDPAMQKDVDERLEIERGLRIALESQQLQMYYQPKVDVEGRIIGAEALIRWKHPVHGFISPASFIPVAEETGLIHLIGDWIIDTIIGDLVRWSEHKLTDFGDVSINISAWQFARPDFITKTMAVIRQSNIPSARFSAEVTETAILRDIGATREKLVKLREFGIAVALDDFGTGYSSLAYLKDLPLDAFKIDRAFVDGLHNTQTEALVNSMIAIGRHMNLKVIAEGVETEEQFNKLVAMGCTMFQGYLFARPMAEPDFVCWVKENLSQATAAST